MEKKKPTNAQLQSMIKNALVFVPKDKETKSVYFSDRGLRLTVTEDFCVVATNFHSHVFDRITSNGHSRPYLYVSQFVDMALNPSNDCKVKLNEGGYTYSFARLLECLKDKKEQTDFLIAKYVEWWLYNISSPLYGIDENSASQFIALFDYMHNIAKNSIVLEEHKEGLTNKQFAEKYVKLMEEFLKDVEEVLIFTPMSDEERMQKTAEALQEEELNENLKQ